MVADTQHVPRCLAYRTSVAREDTKRAKTPLQVALVKAGVDIEVAAVGRRGGKLVAALIELVGPAWPLNPDELHFVFALWR